MVKIKKLNILELFGGIGAIRKALINLRVDFEVLDYVEVGYKLERGEDDLYIGHNVSDKVVPFNVETGRYRVLVMNNQAKAEGLREIDVIDKIDLSPLSTIVLQRIPTKDKPINAVTITQSNNQQNSQYGGSLRTIR